MGSQIMNIAGVGIGILVLILVYAIVPLVGSEIDNATGDLPADSDWNATYNTDLETGASLWETLAGLLTLAAVIDIIGFTIRAVMQFRKGATG